MVAPSAAGALAVRQRSPVWVLITLVGNECPGIGPRPTFVLVDWPVDDFGRVLTLCELLDWCPGLRKETDCVIARVEDCRWRKIDLCTRRWLGAARHDFVESSGGEFDVINNQASDIAVDKVDNYL